MDQKLLQAGNNMLVHKPKKCEQPHYTITLYIDKKEMERKMCIMEILCYSALALNKVEKFTTRPRETTLKYLD